MGDSVYNENDEEKAAADNAYLVRGPRTNTHGVP